MRGFDPIAERHPRLIDWAKAFRAADWPLREIARLFDVSPADLIEAGVEP